MSTNMTDLVAGLMATAVLSVMFVAKGMMMALVPLIVFGAVPEAVFHTGAVPNPRFAEARNGWGRRLADPAL